MKKMLLNLSNALLSAEQTRNVKGGWYEGTASNTPGIITYTPPNPGGGGGGPSNDCPGCYNRG